MNSPRQIKLTNARKTSLHIMCRNLLFQYAEDKRVDVPYNITEIKQAPIVCVDCDGVTK